MLLSDSEDIQKIIFDRLDKIHERILPLDREYVELEKKPEEILQQLLTTLPSEQQNLLDDYDSSRTALMNRQDELVYIQGMADGILLGRWVDQLRQGAEKFLTMIRA